MEKDDYSYENLKKISQNQKNKQNNMTIISSNYLVYEYHKAT
jgi:hypothetical protein